jgi:uncharacterized protein YqhQ
MTDYAGGQAIIEGVMMKYGNKVAYAVRKPSKKISIKKETLRKWSIDYPFVKWPFFRGIITLIDTLVLGIKALNWSANESTDEEDEKLSTAQIFWTLFISFLFSAVLFIIIPLWLTHLTQTQGILFNVIDGILRVGIFILYILIISRLDDVKRIFEYHGAEHKTINAYEKGLKLTVANVKKQTTLHKRCGTTFIIIVLFVSIIVFSFITWEGFWAKLLGRILLIPVIAGIAYELLRLGAKKDNVLLKVFTIPGFWVQRLTTREPDKEQIEVAIKSLKAVL